MKVSLVPQEAIGSVWKDVDGILKRAVDTVKDKSEVIHYTNYEYGEYSQNTMLAHLISACDKAGYIPCEIEVRRPDLELLMQDLFGDSGVDIERVAELAVVKDCLANLIAQIMNRQFQEQGNDCCAAGTCSS